MLRAVRCWHGVAILNLDLTHTFFCLRAHTHAPVCACLSSLAAGTASCVIGTRRGRMQKRNTPHHKAWHLRPNKHRVIDGFLVFGRALSRPSARPLNRRQWTPKRPALPLNSVWKSKPSPIREATLTSHRAAAGPVGV